MQQAKHADPKRHGMALSDSELAAITQLLSLHQWAEPGLVRVSCKTVHVSASSVKCVYGMLLFDAAADNVVGMHYVHAHI